MNAVDALREAAVVRGHRVGVLAGNTQLHVEVHRAARVLDAAVVPGDPRAPPTALSDWAERCGVEAVVCEESLRGAATALGLPLFVGRADGEVVEVPRALGRPAVPASGLAAVVQTSGTSGSPRAIAVPEACLAEHAAAASERIGSGPESAWLGVLALHHIGGVAMVDRCLRSGAGLVLHERFDAGRVASALGEVTHVSLVPVMLERLLEAGARPPPDLQCVLVGGDHCPPELLARALAAGWPVFVTYGCTEACSQVATATPAQSRERPGTAGRPLTGVQVRIVTGGREVPEGETGLIEVRGRTVPTGAARPGDLGRLEDGFLHVVGRVDARIVSGGATIDAVAVEQAVASHPAVAEACVVGIADLRWGQRVACAVVLREGAWRDVEEAVLAHVRSRVAPAEVPRLWRQVDRLPQTGTGKVARAAVRALFEA